MRRSCLSWRRSRCAGVSRCERRRTRECASQCAHRMRECISLCERGTAGPACRAGQARAAGRRCVRVHGDMRSHMRAAWRYAFPYARRMAVCIPVYTPHEGCSGAASRGGAQVALGGVVGAEKGADRRLRAGPHDVCRLRYAGGHPACTPPPCARAPLRRTARRVRRVCHG